MDSRALEVGESVWAWWVCGLGGCVVDGTQLDKEVRDLEHAVRMIIPRVVFLEHANEVDSV